MNLWLILFGEGDQISPSQMALRALTLYFIALILVRISGRRTFGKKTTFDNVVVILLGAVLSRAVVGASPYWATVSAGLVLVCIHRLLAWLSIQYPKLGQLINGKQLILYKNGQFHSRNMSIGLVSEADLLEAIRQNGNINSFDKVKEIYMERSGSLSIIEADN